ncbi:MAG: RNA 2',3'-cyclic phosphodiesterase [Candidatus Firestonebacteria bacterium]|nr:RNA 2',3'-cyclic phosphodiesterase [Candidatus Firestonebacteria bacterium]
MSSENIRMFIAVDINKEIKNRIEEIYKKLTPITAFVKWTNMEQIHITLKFFPHFPLNKLSFFYETVSSVVCKFKPFIFTISGLGVFPDIKHARVIWTGIQEGLSSLYELQSQLDHTLKARELADIEDRSFNPHITIARIKETVGIKSFLEKIDINDPLFMNLGTQKVNNIKIIKSVLTPMGAQYTELKTIYFNTQPEIMQ